MAENGGRDKRDIPRYPRYPSLCMQDGEITCPPGADLGPGDCGSLGSSRVREKRDVPCAKFFAQHVPRVAPHIASEKSEREVLLLLGGGASLFCCFSLGPQTGEQATTLISLRDGPFENV